MKTIVLLLIIACLSSCYKDYNCQCYTVQGHLVSRNLAISGRKKSDAVKLCNQYSNTDETCELH